MQPVPDFQRQKRLKHGEELRRQIQLNLALKVRASSAQRIPLQKVDDRQAQKIQLQRKMQNQQFFGQQNRPRLNRIPAVSAKKVEYQYQPQISQPPDLHYKLALPLQQPEQFRSMQPPVPHYSNNSYPLQMPIEQSIPMQMPMPMQMQMQMPITPTGGYHPMMQVGQLPQSYGYVPGQQTQLRAIVTGQRTYEAQTRRQEENAAVRSPAPQNIRKGILRRQNLNQQQQNQKKNAHQKYLRDLEEQARQQANRKKQEKERELEEQRKEEERLRRAVQQQNRQKEQQKRRKQQEAIKKEEAHQKLLQKRSQMEQEAKRLKRREKPELSKAVQPEFFNKAQPVVAKEEEEVDRISYAISHNEGFNNMSRQFLAQMRVQDSSKLQGTQLKIIGLQKQLELKNRMMNQLQKYKNQALNKEFAYKQAVLEKDRAEYELRQLRDQLDRQMNINLDLKRQHQQNLARALKKTQQRDAGSVRGQERADPFLQKPAPFRPSKHQKLITKQFQVQDSFNPAVANESLEAWSKKIPLDRFQQDVTMSMLAQKTVVEYLPPKVPRVKAPFQTIKEEDYEDALDKQRKTLESRRSRKQKQQWNISSVNSDVTKQIQQLLGKDRPDSRSSLKKAGKNIISSKDPAFSLDSQGVVGTFNYNTKKQSYKEMDSLRILQANERRLKELGTFRGTVEEDDLSRLDKLLEGYRN